MLPVEQPSWVGQTTEATSGIEAIGFEPTALPEDGPTPDEAPAADFEESAAATVDPTDVDLSESPEAEEEPELIGEYGVAGPEAFDALEEDDASTGELDDWGAFMEGSPPATEAVAPGEGAIAPADPLLGDEELEGWVAPEPKKRRGLFRRRKRDRVEGVIEDGFVGTASGEDAALAEPEPDPSRFGTPEELPAAGDAYDEWVESEPEERRGLIGKRDGAEDLVDPVGEEAAVGFEDSRDEAEHEPAAVVEPDAVVDAAVVDALEALEADALTPAGEPPVGEMVVESAATHPVDEADDVVEPVGDEWQAGSNLGEQPDLFGDFQDVVPTADAEASTEGPVAEQDAGLAPVEPVEHGDIGLDDGRDWEGDPGRVPAAWFAEIDEDEVVPPTSVESPEVDWPEAPEGPRYEGEGQVEPPDVFDVEDPIAAGTQPGVVEQQPQEAVPIPEGYEPWHEAVSEAVEAGAAAGQHADDGTYEYDQPVLQDSSDDLPAQGLPAGFEPFPGETGMEQFEISEETLRDELGSDDVGQGWVTEQVDPGQMPTQEMDTPLPVGEEFDEQIYAAGGTIEHRDLAAAIAEAGEEDTQWEAISAAMPGVETGVVGFDDVKHLGSGGDYVAAARSNLGLRVVTGVALVGLLFGSLFIADVAFAVFVSLIVMLGLSEFYGSLRRSGYLPLGLFGLLGGAGTLFAVWFHGPLAIAAGVLLTSTVTFFFYAFSQTRRDALSNAGLTVLGVGWVIGPIAFVIPIVRAEEHVVLVFAIVAITAATDVGAFAFGRAWGKSPLAPVLSPNKTAEGLAGGVMLALIVAAAIGFFELGPFDLRSGLALGAIIAFLAPIGDLAESMIKRSLGIKDMGSILPGHGGVLDRIDAFLFVIPAAWVFYETIGFLG